ncbi:hypothetical protein PQR37_13255 [Paraburkholderia nemoris]|uniref:hypothetical protein n=1 Tax=Paraburkholderia nemoris TaxID=2793076 RepID=UPI0038B8DD4D
MSHFLVKDQDFLRSPEEDPRAAQRQAIRALLIARKNWSDHRCCDAESGIKISFGGTLFFVSH